ncbi:hypothetical protein PR202_ga05807 [Eleusine coracana subsp. coracana]|uniref:F-box domain-containing protein n=1 Tax=Eleusine coracana subsp. coracana TaxID=191504 RepID=A0AAV5BUZ7_ELECO|nr:hypothetical protein PR202_ga05807 [Eleusine coracana subsp. coracana]
MMRPSFILDWEETTEETPMRPAVLSFSVVNETFSCLRFPAFWVEGDHLVELDGHLCMVRDLRRCDPDSTTLEIWKLIDYSSSDWSLNYRIDCSGPVVARDLLRPKVVTVIGSVGNCKSTSERSPILIATSKHKVFAYDPISESLEVVHTTMEIQESHQIQPSNVRFSLFRESLVPVHKAKEEMDLSSPLAEATKEILLRLPAKSVVQNCRRVSKQWRRLISSDSFADAFFLHKNVGSRPKIMLVVWGGGPTEFSFTPLHDWLQEGPDQGSWLDTKVVCSKPCHGMNLIL